MSRLAAAVVLAVATTVLAALPPDVQKALDSAKFIYVQSERKSGEFGKPAEIWFFADAGKVYVGTRPDSWRVKRIKAGRTKARIAIGSTGGPTFEATGKVVKNPAIEQRLMAAYATKYPEGWKRHEASFHEGFQSGERVLVEYTPR